MIDWLGKLPTTNLRIFISIVAFGAAIIVWLLLAVLHALKPDIVGAWEPSASMLMFLTAWAAIDVAQFNVKRKTQDLNMPTAQNGPPPGQPSD